MFIEIEWIELKFEIVILTQCMKFYSDCIDIFAVMEV